MAEPRPARALLGVTNEWCTQFSASLDSTWNNGRADCGETSRPGWQSLETSMVSVTPLAPEHFPLVAAWLSDRSVSRWPSTEWRLRDATSVMIAIACRNQRNRLFLIRYD